MSKNYKFKNPEGVYFVSFAIVYWIDIFIREKYFNIIIDSLNFSIKNKGMLVYAWCIMPSHIHLVFKSSENKPSELIRDIKSFTAKEIINEITNNNQESRKEWLLNAFKKASKRNDDNRLNKVWQYGSNPIELYTNKVIEQKIDYIHNNPVESGFVQEAQFWKYSSAVDYSGNKGVVDICFP